MIAPSGTCYGVALPHPLPLFELRDQFGGDLDPDLHDAIVRSVAPPDCAGPDVLVPLIHRRHAAAAARSGAAVLVTPELAPSVPVGRRWIHPYAQYVLACVLDLAAPPIPSGIHPTALIEEGVVLGARARIGAYAVLLSGCEMGDDCIVEPHAVVYGRVRCGNCVVIGAGAVVGREGFGWCVGPDGQPRRIPQLGGVVIEDAVEVGPHATVDAGTLAPTVLRAGCKLDAHVHVGHNVQIGRGTMVAAQSGFAGSCKIGDGVLVGGQVGVADHVTIGAGARLGARAGVIGNVPEGLTVAGYPAVERMRWLRSVARALRGPST